MNPKSWIQAHPLIAYFGLAYALAWGGSLLVAGSTRLQGEAVTMGQILLIFLSMMLAPAIAGVLVTSAVDGRSGLRALWKRMTRWRVGGRWYAVALLTMPAVLLSVLAILATFVSPDYRPEFRLLFGLVAGGLAGIFEEIGWTGFATPQLLDKYGVWGSGFRLGLLWGVWHMMGGLLGSTPGQEAFWLADFFLFWILSLSAYRMLMTWVYSNTGSVPVGQLMHVFFTGTLGAVVPVLSHSQTLLYDVLLACVLYGLVAAVVLLARRTQEQPALRPDGSG